jgi:enhancing lycopene biosynthesis protein 2
MDYFNLMDANLRHLGLFRRKLIILKCLFNNALNMKKFAVVLSGSGVFDGAEIQEAVMTLLAIDKNGAGYTIFAPDIPQYHVINHLTHEVMKEKRNVLVESARIARGMIKPLSDFNPADYDALIFPGGFGSAKNLSTWAFEGDNSKVDPGVSAAIKGMHAMKKPVGALCISPVILAGVIKGAILTTGNDPSSAAYIEKMGSSYKKSGHGEVVVDRVNNLYTTPCYMLDATISQIAEGADNIVKAMMA